MSKEIKRFDADHIEGYAEYPGGRFCEYFDAEQRIKTLEKENTELRKQHTKLENKLDNFYFALEPPKVEPDEKRPMHQILLDYIKELKKKADMWESLKNKIRSLPGSEIYIKNLMEEIENE